MVGVAAANDSGLISRNSSMYRKSAVRPRDPSRVAATTSSRWPLSSSNDSDPLAYRIDRVCFLRNGCSFTIAAISRNVVNAIALFCAIMRTFLESKRYKCAKINIRAKCVLPDCLATRRRLDLRMKFPSSSSESMSRKTHSCHGRSGIPISIASCETSSIRLFVSNKGL